MADRRLQVFFAVAKQGSFTRAAESLFMTQPAVTFQIKQLEEQFNCRLFERQHLKIALTDEGRLVYEYAERILALSDEMAGRIAEITGQMGGQLVVGASTTLGEHVLPAVLADFNAEHPQVQLRLCVGNSESIKTRVVESSIDVGFIGGEGDPKLLSNDVVGQERIVVVCDPTHPFAKQAAVIPGDLLEYEYVARESGSGTRDCVADYFRQQKLEADQLKVVMELGSPGAVKGVVKTGLGFALMSQLAVVDELKRGELVAVPLDPPLTRPISMLMPKERFRSRTISAFIDFTQRRLRVLTA